MPDKASSAFFKKDEDKKEETEKSEQTTEKDTSLAETKTEK